LRKPKKKHADKVFIPTFIKYFLRLNIFVLQLTVQCSYTNSTQIFKGFVLLGLIFVCYCYNWRKKPCTPFN